MRSTVRQLHLEAASIQAAVDELPAALQAAERERWLEALADRPDLCELLRYHWNLPAEPDRVWKVGDLLRNYKLLEAIGEGGQGNVWRAVRLNGEVTIPFAVKLPRPRTMTPERVREEMELSNRARGPTVILPIHDAFYVDDQPVIVIELVPGGSLASMLRARKGLPLPDPLALAVTIDLLRAAVHLHALDIVHGDIKPGNVLMAEDGTARLTDFGMAHVGVHEVTEGIGGTLPYMVPEAFTTGGSQGKMADLWSIGVILREMIGGQRPWPEKAHPYVPPLPLPEGVPSALRTFLERALAEDPTARFASAVEMLEAVKSVRDALHPRPLSSRPPAARRAWGAIAVLVSVAFAGSVGILGLAHLNLPRDPPHELTPDEVNTSLVEFGAVETQPADHSGTIRARVLRAMTGAIGGCQAAAANQDLARWGELTVVFTITRNGKVLNDRAEGDANLLAGVGACATRAARNAGFSPPPQGPVVVRASFHLLMPPAVPRPPRRRTVGGG